MESFIRFLEVISFDRVGVSGNLKFSTDETGCYSLFCREYIKQIGYGKRKIFGGISGRTA